MFVKVHPNGTLEGSPEELAQYQKLMQAKPEPKAPPSTMNPWPSIGSGMITGRPDQFPPLWNGFTHVIETPAPYIAWANIRDQAEGVWALVTGDKITPL
jgi:hypothetical protein